MTHSIQQRAMVGVTTLGVAANDEEGLYRLLGTRKAGPDHPDSHAARTTTTPPAQTTPPTVDLMPPAEPPSNPPTA
jgi:hypothetical protein